MGPRGRAGAAAVKAELGRLGGSGGGHGRATEGGATVRRRLGRGRRRGWAGVPEAPFAEPHPSPTHFVSLPLLSSTVHAEGKMKRGRHPHARSIMPI